MLHLKFQIIGVANCYQVADNEQASIGRVRVQEYRGQTRCSQLANTGEEGARQTCETDSGIQTASDEVHLNEPNMGSINDSDISKKK